MLQYTPLNVSPSSYVTKALNIGLFQRVAKTFGGAVHNFKPEI
jgi:hypothetical protein